MRASSGMYNLFQCFEVKENQGLVALLSNGATPLNDQALVQSHCVVPAELNACETMLGNLTDLRITGYCLPDSCIEEGGPVGVKERALNYSVPQCSSFNACLVTSNPLLKDCLDVSGTDDFEICNYPECNEGLGIAAILIVIGSLAAAGLLLCGICFYIKRCQIAAAAEERDRLVNPAASAPTYARYGQ